MNTALAPAFIPGICWQGDERCQGSWLRLGDDLRSEDLRFQRGAARGWQKDGLGLASSQQFPSPVSESESPSVLGLTAVVGGDSPCLSPNERVDPRCPCRFVPQENYNHPNH